MSHVTNASKSHRRRLNAEPVEWWETGGYGTSFVAAWTAKDAASLANSYVDRTGNSNHLTGATPTWDAAIGWTSSVHFNDLALMSGGAFTAFWRGKIVSTDELYIWHNPGGAYVRLVGRPYPPAALYIGANTDNTPRFVYTTIAQNTDLSIIYQKRADHSQRLWISGSEIAGSPKAGTAYSNNNVSLATNSGGMCAAAGIALAELSEAAVLAIESALMAL